MRVARRRWGAVRSGLAPTVLLLLSLPSLVVGQTAQRGSVDWIFVLDTSASMRGADGSANIFSDVQSAIVRFIQSTREGDTITLYTFDSEIILKSNTRVSGDIDKNDLIAIVNGLSANGNRTYTGKALHDALARVEELNRRPDTDHRTVSIVLFTDGREDVRGIANPISIPSNILLIPKKRPYIFFVSLGTQDHEPQLDDFVRDSGQGEVIRDPGAKEISDVGDRIRTKIESPPPPKDANLRAEPSILDFGQIESGEKTAQQTVKIHSDADVRVRLSLNKMANSAITLVEPSGPVDITAGKDVSVAVRLQAAPQTQNGTQTIGVIITPEAIGQVQAAPVNVNASVSIVRIPVWRKSIKWIVLFLILAILAIVAASIVKAEPPWIWIPQTVGGIKLEGEIEVMQPRPARVEDEFISLTQQQTKSLRLSTLLPLPAKGESDAEMTASKSSGERIVELRRVAGVVRVNSVEVAATSIYDGDVIELGDTRLRFNWAGHPRPIDPTAEDLI